SSSARAPYATDALLKLLIPKFHIATLFAPDLFGNPATRTYWPEGTYIERVSYIGVLPLFFAFYAVWKKRDAVTWFFITVAIVILFLSFDTYPSRLFYSLGIPYLSTAVPTRIMFLFCFCASILSAFGLDVFLATNKKNIRIKPVMFLGMIYIFLFL